MRVLALSISISLGALVIATGACDSDDPANTGGGGSDTTTSTASGGNAGSTTTSTTSAGACEGAPDGACGACMGEACCEVLTDCNADLKCKACVEGTDTLACDTSEETHTRAVAFLECRGGPCAAPCVGASDDCQDKLDGFVAAECQTCLETNCCAQVGACYAKEGCWIDCFTQHSELDCHADPDGHALYHALGACYQQSCATACAAPTVDLACDGLPGTPPSQGACVSIAGATTCNPLTNEGCTDAGYACDANQSSGFSCFGPPNDRALCATCGQAEGFCLAGHTCVGGQCGRYCCDDGDCGASGRCDTSLLAGGAGVCVNVP